MALNLEGYVTGGIVIISDSMSLPRYEPETVSVLETYPALLNRHFGGVINIAYGASSSNNVLWQAGYLKNATVPGVYIFNFGIVDCTPRVLHRGEAWLLRKLGLRLPEVVTKWLRQQRLIRKVAPDAFRKNCRAIKALSLGELLVLCIAPASDEFESEVPGIQASVALYNSILAEEFGDAFCAVELNCHSHIMSDYHHLTVGGHRQIFEYLRQRLEMIFHKQ
jgi:hypothetical protein